EVPQAAHHVVLRPGDDGRQTPRHAGRDDQLKGFLNFAVRGVRPVEIDAGKTVHLNVDQPRRDPDVRFRRRRLYPAHTADNLIEFDLEKLTGRGVPPGTNHAFTVLCTAH